MRQVLFQVATMIFSGIIFLVVEPSKANAETEANTEKVLAPVSFQVKDPEYKSMEILWLVTRLTVEGP